MKMHGMTSTVKVVDDHFNQIALLNNPRICIHAIHKRFLGIAACGQRCVQGWHFLFYVGDIVEAYSRNGMSACIRRFQRNQNRTHTYFAHLFGKNQRLAQLKRQEALKVEAGRLEAPE